MIRRITKRGKKVKQIEGVQQEFADLFVILYGIVMGTLARFITLRVEQRQNPSYPNGYFINLVTGFVAACLGAVAVPALLEKNYTAVTFLAMGIQHFRDIRKIEQESLTRLEAAEYVSRGEAYIDGIAKTYEARNYISLLTAVVTVLATKFFYRDNFLLNTAIAMLAGGIVILLLSCLTKGKSIGDICEVKQAEIKIEGSDLLVDGIFVSGVFGTDFMRDFFLQQGLAFVVTPKEPKYALTMENYGQRQAMLFEAVRSYGARRFKFTRRSFDDNRLVIAFVPIINEPQGIIDTIKRTPVLESSKKVQEGMEI